MVDVLGGGGGAEEVEVLRVDCCDEVVDARHLDHGEEGDEEEPGGADLVPGGGAVEGAPDAGGVLFRGFFGVLFGGGFAEEGGHFVDGGVVVVGGSGGVFDGGEELADGFVGVGWHDEELDDEDVDGDDEVDEEELLGGEGGVGGGVDEAVEEEDGAGGVEGPGEKGEDET